MPFFFYFDIWQGEKRADYFKILTEFYRKRSKLFIHSPNKFTITNTFLLDYS